VGKETHPPAATGAILARLSTVTSRVEPALENPMRVLACVTLLATPLAKIGARRAGVVILSGITAASLFAGVGVRTLGPVM